MGIEPMTFRTPVGALFTELLGDSSERDNMIRDMHANCFSWKNQFRKRE